MLDFRKLLLPVDLEEPSRAAIRQAALLAQHFHSELVILHAIGPWSHPLVSKEEFAKTVKREEQRVDTIIAPEMAGVSMRRLVLKGDPAAVIVETARQENAGLIIVGPHVYAGRAEAQLLGSVTENIVSTAGCPIWSCGQSGHLSGHRGERAGGVGPRLPLHHVMCGLDLTPRDQDVVRWASEVAAEFGARLTLAHVTPEVEIYGPGGYQDVHELKEDLMAAAEERMRTFLDETRVKGATRIGNGDVAKVLNEIARQTGAELLVIGRHPARGMLGGHSYAIVSRSIVPVLAV